MVKGTFHLRMYALLMLVAVPECFRDEYRTHSMCTFFYFTWECVTHGNTVITDWLDNCMSGQRSCSCASTVEHSLVINNSQPYLSQAAQLRQPCVNSHWPSQWEALGTRHFWPPTESTYINRSLKNLSQVIKSMTSTAVQNLVEIRPWGLRDK